MNCEEESRVVIAGWLSKMKRIPSFLTQWDKRWMTIENGALNWRQEKADCTAGCLALDSSSSVYTVKLSRSNPLRLANSNSIFMVKSKKRNLRLKARSREDCDRWVRVIQMQIDLQAGRAASRNPSPKKRHLKNSCDTNKFEVSMLYTSSNRDFLYCFPFWQYDISNTTLFAALSSVPMNAADGEDSPVELDQALRYSWKRRYEYISSQRESFE